MESLAYPLKMPMKMLTWDCDVEGDWAEHVKGVDDYLYGLEQKKKESSKNI